MDTQEQECLEVLRAWNRCHGAFYQVRENDLLWNLRDQKLLRYSPGVAAGVPILWAEPTAAGVAAGILEKGIWVSLFGAVDAGREAEFAAALESSAMGRGASRLAIGSDEFHFLPGIPVDEPTGSRIAQICRNRGFITADCADFVGKPANPACAEYVRGARKEAEQRGWSLTLVEGSRDEDLLSEFLQREFRGRWVREWDFWRGRGDTARGFWNLLRDENGRALGFSRLARRGRFPRPAEGWTPGALRLPLSTGTGVRDTDSCLGPIGISAAERGRGAGKILLGLSIHELSLQGAERTCIDWTNAYNYYTPLSFVVARRYLTAWKEL